MGRDVGSGEGAFVGTGEGSGVGSGVGWDVGSGVGCIDGSGEGCAVGRGEGVRVGAGVGLGVGHSVGTEENGMDKEYEEEFNFGQHVFTLVNVLDENQEITKYVRSCARSSCALRAGAGQP